MFDILTVLLDLIGHQYARDSSPSSKHFELPILGGIVGDVRDLVLGSTLGIVAVASVKAGTVGMAVGGNGRDV